MSFDLTLSLTFILLPLCFACICLYYCFYFLRAARLMQDTPISKVRSAAQGYVELNGVAASPPSLHTFGKLTQFPCVWYRYTIHEWVPRYQNNMDIEQSTSNSQLIEQGVSHIPFLLQDGTGECVVFPFGAEILPIHSTTWRGDTLPPPKPPTTWWQSLLWGNTGKFQYSEQRIELNDPLYVTGVFKTLSKDDPAVQGDPLLRQYCEVNPTLAYINSVSQKDLPKDHVFLLSARSSNSLTLGFKIKAAGFFIAFLLFSSFSVSSAYPIVVKALQDSRTQK